MKKLLSYLSIYTIIVLFLVWWGQGTIEKGYERLYWFSIFLASGILMVPVLIADLINCIIKIGEGYEKETNTKKK
jgi:hypothetical protein